MNRINQEIIELFKQICILDVDDLNLFLGNFLKKYYNDKKVIQTDNYILAEGDLPIALCAHMDTVAVNPPQSIFYDEQESVLWSPNLLGADDRAGVFAIIWTIICGFRPMVIFTTDEEIGGLGAKALVQDFPKMPFGKIKFIIQLDRRGSQDAVYYFCDNDDFKRVISSYGFKTAYGTFTDISIIAPAWGCAAVNLSVGYYNEHFVNEFLRLNELLSTITKVKNILNDNEFLDYYNYIPSKISFSYSSPIEVATKCGICNKIFGKKEKTCHAYGLTVCKKCYEEYCI